MKYLSAAKIGKQQNPRRVLVYGTPGIGKSTFASCAPNPIFISTEGGLDDINTTSVEVKSLDDVLAMIGELYSEEHDFKTVVIDSIDWLQDLIYTKVCQQQEPPKDSIEDIGYGKGYKFALTHWRTILDGLEALRRDRGMMVLLVAHAQIERFNNPETEPYDRYTPKLHKDAAAMVVAWCNEVLYASYPVAVKSTDEGFQKKRTRGVSTGRRVLRTVETPACVAKNRLNLPDEIPLEFAAYAELAGIATDTNPPATTDTGDTE